MPTTYVYPVSEGFYTAGILLAGASKTAAALSDDGDTGYFYIAVDTQNRQSFVMDAIGGIASVTEVKSAMKIKAITGTNCKGETFIRIGGANRADGVTYTNGSTWTLYASGAYTRPGGGTYSQADFVAGAFECGAREQLSADANLGVTWIYGIVTFVPNAGGFAFGVASWLGPMFGAGLLMSEMPKLSSYLRKISGHGMMSIADSIAYKHLRNSGIGSHYTILPHEYETAFREIKEAKHTTLFDIGGVSAKIA